MKARGSREERSRAREPELPSATVHQEQLRKLQDDWQTFVYRVSHDLQEPVRMVASFCELLERHLGGDLDERGRKYLEFTLDGAARIRGRLECLLAYSRVETQARPLRRVDAREVLFKALAGLRTDVFVLREHVIVPEERHFVIADPAQLTQVFTVLIDNALRFSGEEPRVECTIEAEGTETRFRVIDQGPGIAPEHHERIFAIFQHLQDSRTYSGAGAGLAIAKRIVEYRGGRIGVESKPGEGAIFWFTVPTAGGDGVTGFDCESE